MINWHGFENLSTPSTTFKAYKNIKSEQKSQVEPHKQAKWKNKIKFLNVASIFPIFHDIIGFSRMFEQAAYIAGSSHC